MHAGCYKHVLPCEARVTVVVSVCGLLNISPLKRFNDTTYLTGSESSVVFSENVRCKDRAFLALSAIFT